MKALIYLYYLTMKGKIRHTFSKPSSAIFALLMILIYGGLFITLSTNGQKALSILNLTDVNIAIFVGIGFTAFMVGIMLMQSRKALFMENDAFYLFTGPFKRSQIMQYIISQSLVNALFCGALSLFMMIMIGSHMQYDIGFILLVFFSHCLTYLFFTILYYYVYLLSIKDKKYKSISWIIIALFVGIVVAVFAYVFVQNGNSMQNIGIEFLNSDAFYFVPLFGWIKMILISYIAKDLVLLSIGMALLLISCGGAYFLMTHYKGDFVEQAMQDSIALSVFYKEAKAGNQSALRDKKVRNVKSVGFKEGAGAIFSKNMLIMKKSNSFLSTQDIIFIVIYMAISLILNMGFVFFMYMMILWLFVSIQNAEFMKEMKNYQIYLIPEDPFKKLWYLLLPYFLKYIVISIIPILIGGLLMHVSIFEFFQYYLMMAGYACLFIAATVLSTRILKSRNNVMMENMMRMLIVFLSAVPSIIMIIVVIAFQLPFTNIMGIISIMSLLINFVIAGLILFGCKNMMNGREIQSE